MHPHQPSIRPPVTGSETISKDFEKISLDAQPPKAPRKAVSQKMLSLKVSVSPILSGKLLGAAVGRLCEAQVRGMVSS